MSALPTPTALPTLPAPAHAHAPAPASAQDDRLFVLCLDTVAGMLFGTPVENNQPDFYKALNSLFKQLVDLGFKVVLISSASPRVRNALFRFLPPEIYAMYRPYISKVIVHPSSLTQESHDRMVMSDWYRKRILEVMQEFNIDNVLCLSCIEDLIGALRMLNDEGEISDARSGIFRAEQPISWCEAINLIKFFQHHLEDISRRMPYFLFNIRSWRIAADIRQRVNESASASSAVSTVSVSTVSASAVSAVSTVSASDVTHYWLETVPVNRKKSKGKPKGKRTIELSSVQTRFRPRDDKDDKDDKREDDKDDKREDDKDDKDDKREDDKDDKREDDKDGNH